jgi:hypothetical protein
LLAPDASSGSAQARLQFSQLSLHFLAHAFLTMEGEARFMAMNVFLEHLGLIGGFVMTALVAEHAKREGR